MAELYLKADGHIVYIKNESSVVYSDGASQDLAFPIRYRLGENHFVPTTAHSVHYGEPILHSCLLLASGGSTTVHAKSGLLHNDHCLVAGSSFLACLQLPDLNLVWQTQVDDATCFGIYHLPQYESYLSHGELDIARVSYDGSILWSCGGKDIFTGSLTLYDNYVDVIDFNNEIHRIDLLTGHPHIISS
jgi:hypothetical protein